jgi:hypothetical protein
LTGFPRTVLDEDAYNQRQETAAVSRGYACSVALGHAAMGGDADSAHQVVQSEGSGCRCLRR